jgi:UDP-N-acetylglucosamine acyltransferase
LRRRDFSAQRIAEIKRAFRTLYSAGLPLMAAKDEIAQRAEFSEDLRLISDFLAASERSIVR